MSSGTGAADYVFRVEFRLEPGQGLTLSPDSFETVLRRRADPPGEPGWRFFRDALWRGELADPDHLRSELAAELGVRVTAASFGALRTDEAHLESLRSAVAEDLDEFRTGSVDEALSTHLGSSIRVVSDTDG